MKLIPTKLPDVMILEPKVFGDHRGFFMETWREEVFHRAGIDIRFVQENHSRSTQGTLRGLHYQLVRPQGKLVRAVAGEIFDVAVDVRKRSPTFGQWTGHRLSAENKLALWVPAGFAHGFYVMSESAEVVYSCTDYYAPEHECGLYWGDESVGIEWPFEGQAPILSSKDAEAPRLADAEVFE